MNKRRLYFHIFLIVTALLIGGLPIWDSGWMIEGKNFPNFSAIAMVLSVIGQFAQIKTYQNRKNS